MRRGTNSIVAETLVTALKVKLSISINNFKTTYLEEELELPKGQLKSENHVMLHKTGNKLVKKGRI